MKDVRTQQMMAFTPSQDLAPGEYALVSTAAQAQGGGFGQSAAAGSYFDFGVD